MSKGFGKPCGCILAEHCIIAEHLTAQNNVAMCAQQKGMLSTRVQAGWTAGVSHLEQHIARHHRLLRAVAGFDHPAPTHIEAPGLSCFSESQYHRVTMQIKVHACNCTHWHCCSCCIHISSKAAHQLPLSVMTSWTPSPCCMNIFTKGAHQVPWSVSAVAP